MCRVNGSRFDNCYFVRNTLVNTAMGWRFIKNINLGDLVYSRNPITFECGYKKVVDVHSKAETDFIYIVVYLGPGYETVETTAGNVFFTVERGWIRAEDLKTGEHLLRENGHAIKIESVGKAHTDKPLMVYNLSVEDWHSYFVLKSGILVRSDNMMTDENDSVKIDDVFRNRGPVLGAATHIINTGACGRNPFLK